MRSVLTWLSQPENLALLGAALYGLLSTVAAVLARLGWVRATATTTAVVRGVEVLRAALPAAESAAVASTIQAESTAAGVEHVLAPIVRAVQAEPARTPSTPPAVGPTP